MIFIRRPSGLGGKFEPAGYCGHKAFSFDRLGNKVAANINERSKHSTTANDNPSVKQTELVYANAPSLP
jgi:hypothetical protein